MNGVREPSEKGEEVKTVKDGNKAGPLKVPYLDESAK